jgi:hypothetical protein
LIGAWIRISLSDVKLVVEGGAVGLEVELVVERSLDLRSKLAQISLSDVKLVVEGGAVGLEVELVVERSLDLRSKLAQIRIR